MITGTADRLEVRRMGAHVGVDVGANRNQMLDRPAVRETTSEAAAPTSGAGDKLEFAKRRAQAKDALIKMGWKPREANAAIAIAAAALDTHATIEAWLREALRHCRASARERE